MSAALTHKVTMDAIRAGASWFLEKPFDRSELWNAIRQGGAPEPIDLSLSDATRAHIERVLKAHQGNKSAAARSLGLSRQALQLRLKRDGD